MPTAALFASGSSRLSLTTPTMPRQFLPTRQVHCPHMTPPVSPLRRTWHYDFCGSHPKLHTGNHMPQGSAELLVPVAQQDAFAFLSDPRNAGAWFSDAGFAVPPVGTPRLGMTWTVAQTAETRRPVPTRMSVYEPQARFAWETALGRRTINWMWQAESLPALADEGGPPPPTGPPRAPPPPPLPFPPPFPHAPIPLAS